MRQITSFIIIYLIASNILAKEKEILLFSTSVKKVHLLELYSTQSCSSCPPAQEWISSLKSNPKIWKNFIPVVYHVNYWDYLGWKDPYSKAEFTDRQRKVNELGLSPSVYTPMFALDGKEWRRTLGVSQLLNSDKAVGELKVLQIKSGEFEVRFAPSTKQSGSFRVFGALQGNEIRTDVKSGENNGKNLAHDYLVLDFKNAPLQKGPDNNYYSAVVKFNTKIKRKNLASPSLAFWVESSHQPMEPIQAVGGKIDKGALF